MRRRRVLPAADSEFMRASRWHAVQRPGLGYEYVSAVEATIERAVEAPEEGSPYLYGTRRMVVARFHYDVIYVAREQELLVIAIAHHRRKPGYWRKRLKDIPGIPI